MVEVIKLAVIGAGTMGSGIVQAAAQVGIDVRMVDLDENVLQKGIDEIKKNLTVLKEKEKITEEQELKIFSSIKTTLDIKEALKDVDIVIEAVPENLVIKQDVFRRMDAYCDENVILASCTSGISITAIASVTKRREQVIGMHFTNPVPKMKGVAVILGMDTSEETLIAVKKFLRVIGKEHWITNDFPGFSGTRIIGMYINEAFNVLQSGIASAEDIDKEMKMVFGHPMGPLELADFAGLDVILSSLEYLNNELGDKYCPNPILKQFVAAGYYGRKTGRGVYEYNKEDL